MAGIAPFVLNQAALEIQYDRGFTYYDKCGSLVLKLQDALGAPKFEANVPQMTLGELRNDAERIVVQYGPKSYHAIQSWMPSLARFEQLAPIGWEQVAASLDVGHQVVRCGVRFWLLLRSESYEDAQKMVERLGLVQPGPPWRAMFGTAMPTGLAAIVKEAHGTVRIAVDAAVVKVQPETLPQALAGVIPSRALLLDLDHIYPGSAVAAGLEVEPFPLHRAQVRDFIRASWERSRAIGAEVARVLGVEHAA